MIDRIVVAGLGPDRGGSSASKVSIACFKFQAAAQSVASMKDGVTTGHGLAVVGSQAGVAGPHAGDYVAAVQGGSGRNVIKFWSWKKEQPVLTSTCPEKLGPLVATKCGTYLVGGGSSGSCYLWQVSTGSLVRTWKAHYLSVSCCTFVDDDSVLLTGSDDAIIRAWGIGDLLDNSSKSNVRARATLSNHTLPVTDLWVGCNGLASRVISSSLDHSVKFWSLYSKEDRPHLLRSVLLPCPIQCIVSDSLECMAFAGGSNGVVYQIATRLQEPPKTREESALFQDRRRSEKERQQRMGSEFERALEGHSAAVTCLELSPSGLLLVSGSMDGTCRLWDTSSGQAVKVVPVGGGTRPVLALLSIPVPFELSKGTLGASGKLLRSARIPPLKPLHRYQSRGDQAPNEPAAKATIVQFRPSDVSPVLSPPRKRQLLAQFCCQSAENQVMAPAPGGGRATPQRVQAGNSARIQELEAENADWKRVNSKLYSIAVDKMLSNYSDVK